MATYYVSTYSDGGRDTNPGTIGSPWLTPNHAVETAITPGDVIHINAGTFPVDARLDLYPGVSMEGEGDHTILVSSVTGNPTLLLSSNTINTNGNQSVSYIKFDGDSETAYSAITVYHRGNVELHNLTIVDFSDWGVRFQGRYDDASEPTAGEWAVGNSIHDCTIDNCAAYVSYTGEAGSGNGQGLIEICEQEDMDIYDNVLTQTGRAVNQNGYCIKGIFGFNRDVKIYRNTMTKEPFDNNTWDFAIELWDCRGGIEIYDNTIDAGLDFSGNGGGGTGISNQQGSYDYSLYIHDNIIGPSACTGNGSRMTKGIYVEQSAEGVRIERNLIQNVDMGIYTPLVAKDTDGSGKVFNDVWINSNVFQNIGRSSGDTYGIYMPIYPTLTTGWTCNNVNIWNNTIIGASGVDSGYGIVLPAMGTTTNVSVRNNIVQGFPIAVYGQGAIGVTLDVLSIEKNIFYGNGTNGVYYSGLTPTNNTTQNNIIDNPDFVSSSDFHLATGSPAIGVGLDVSLDIDKDGSAWNATPSIGAYEYGSAPPADIPVTSITVTGAGSATTIAAAGGTLQMSAAVLPVDATDPSYVWGVQAGTGNAWISATGLLHAVADGTVTVRAAALDGSAVEGNLEITISNQTEPSVLILLTTENGSITSNYANGGSAITDAGGLALVVRGVCWATHPVPTVDDFKDSQPVGIPPNSTTTNLINLTSSTTYYNRAYVTDNNGISYYGAERSFVTLAATVVPKNLAPIGWHVAIDAEWTNLFEVLLGESVAGAKLKEVGFEHWDSPNTGATDEIGFKALGSGDRSETGVFSSELRDGTWWSATVYDTDNAYYVSMHHNSLGITRNYYSKKNGFFVRCLKNSSTLTLGQIGTVTDYDGNIYPTKYMPDGKEWMTEDLRVTHFNDGTLIPLVTDNTAWAALTTAGRSEYTSTTPPPISNIISSGLIWYRKGERYGSYSVDYSSDGGVTWELDLIVVDLTEDNIIMTIDQNPVGYRQLVRGGKYVIDQVITSTGFDGIENTDWTNIYTT